MLRLLFVIGVASLGGLSAGTSASIPDYYLTRPTSSFHWVSTIPHGWVSPTATSPPRCNLPSDTMPLATAFPTSSSRQYHHVDVGAGGNQIFQPNQLNASIGDIVRFNFLAVNHSLTQSDFLLPCSSSGGFETGFHQFNPLNTSGQFVVSLEVRTTRSQWFFCAQKTPVSHCRAGMLFGLNPASQMAQFLQNAQSAAGTGASSGNGSVPASSGTSTSNTTSREALELFPPGNTTGPLVLPLATGSAVSAFGSVGNSTPSSILNQTSFNVGPSIQVEQWTNWLFWGGLVLVTHPLLLS